MEPYLELGEGEPSSGADTAVVFDGRATDDGSEFIYRSRSDGSSFGDTRISASELTTRLEENAPSVSSHADLGKISGCVVLNQRRSRT